MLARLATAAALIALAGCAGLEPAGRNAQRAPSPVASAPAPRATPPAPAPAQTSPPASTQQQSPAPVSTPSPVQAPPPAVTLAPAPQTPPAAIAPEASAPAPTSTETASRRSSDGDIVVPGQVQQQVLPPQGDPRSTEERRADVRDWNQCVMQVQNAFDSDPMRPQLTTPEEYCSTSLGMTDRDSVPISRRRR